MLGLGDYGSDNDDDDDDEEKDESASTVPAPSFVLPALAQGVQSSDDDDEDDGAAPAAAEEEEEEEEGERLLPSIDDALNAATVPDFLQREDVGPSYGSMLDQPDPVELPAAAEPPAGARITTSMPASEEPSERAKETNRQRNARKEKLGQATFTLKWDRDCGAEKAAAGLDSSATLTSRTGVGGKGGGKGTQPGGRAAGKGGKGGEALSVKDRTKDKRKRDQSASFLGGRWKTEEEMHMRDNFDS